MDSKINEFKTLIALNYSNDEKKINKITKNLNNDDDD